jgi:hypothetical protein
VRVGRGGFSDSAIAAAALGNVNLGTINIGAGSFPYAIAAHQVSLLTATINGKQLILRRPASQSDVTAALGKIGITSSNLGINVV